MGGAISHGFANLMNFNGSDDRPTFWWWVLFVVIITFGLSMVSGIIFTASAMTSAFEAGTSGANEAEIQSEVMRGMADGFTTQAWVGLIVSALGLLLIIASFTRRLRDAGLPVLIAIIPVLTMAYSSYQTFAIIGPMTEIMASGDMDAMNEFNLSNWSNGLIGWGGYLVVIVCGLFPSKQ